MPMYLVNLHAEEMPKLQAREGLHGATVFALGSGHLDKGEAARVRGSWLRQAGLRKNNKARSKAEMAAAMAAIGVKVSEAPLG